MLQVNVTGTLEVVSGETLSVVIPLAVPEAIAAATCSIDNGVLSFSTSIPATVYYRINGGVWNLYTVPVPFQGGFADVQHYTVSTATGSLSEIYGGVPTTVIAPAVTITPQVAQVGVTAIQAVTHAFNSVPALMCIPVIASIGVVGEKTIKVPVPTTGVSLIPSQILAAIKTVVAVSELYAPTTVVIPDVLAVFIGGNTIRAPSRRDIYGNLLDLRDIYGNPLTLNLRENEVWS